MSLIHKLNDNLIFHILEYIGNLKYILKMRSVNQKFKNTVHSYFKYFNPNVNFKITIPLLLKRLECKTKIITAK